ncbi:TIR domain-containing protein, partial [Tautonia sociabilis]
MANGEFEYDVAVSFAGEDRATAERFAEILMAEGLGVFYDTWEQATLWGRDLYQHLDEVYSKRARFCVMFLSAHYAAKAWTNHELKSAQARAFQENEEYILPLRLDDTVIPGIRPTLGYLDLRKLKVEDAAQLAIQKIMAARSRGTGDKALAQPPASGAMAAAVRTGKLRIKRQFTEQECDSFLALSQREPKWGWARLTVSMEGEAPSWWTGSQRQSPAPRRAPPM